MPSPAHFIPARQDFAVYSILLIPHRASSVSGWTQKLQRRELYPVGGKSVMVPDWRASSPRLDRCGLSAGMVLMILAVASDVWLLLKSARPNLELWHNSVRASSKSPTGKSISEGSYLLFASTTSGRGVSNVSRNNESAHRAGPS